VIDNPINSAENVIGHAALPSLASRLPLSAEPGLDAALIEPVREYLSRESKQVRAQLVRIGCGLASSEFRSLGESQKVLLDCLSCVVEALHAGSLMIDDIQDADDMRRGKASLHMQIGVPRTINAANWLYFWPTDLLCQQALSPIIELEIYRLFHKTMMRAHQGQALDLGHDMRQISQQDVFEISMTAIELKTGELTRMCTELGAIVGEASTDRRSVLAEFGRRFGVALQAFNDIGEFSPKKESINSGRPLIKPSWVWAIAARELVPTEFTRFQQVMFSPDDSSGESKLVLRRVLAKATELARVEFEACMDEINVLIETDAHKLAQSSLRALAEKVMRAYA
jgi:geranylgeranyl pyrophosphate synthase